MKKKILIAIVVVFVLFLLSVFIPIRKDVQWVNDDDISDIGHYEEFYYNIYGGRLSIF